MFIFLHSEGHGKILVISTASIHKVVERTRWKSQVVRYIFLSLLKILSNVSTIQLIDEFFSCWTIK